MGYTITKQDITALRLADKVTVTCWRNSGEAAEASIALMRYQTDADPFGGDFYIRADSCIISDNREGRDYYKPIRGSMSRYGKDQPLAALLREGDTIHVRLVLASCSRDVTALGVTSHEIMFDIIRGTKKYVVQDMLFAYEVVRTDGGGNDYPV